ncbi:Rv2175c family DNA-binding protein [Allokutzneria sp. A3M-2-11 16]|uniref:Rv2175c family DNA-binding protein n=1 Tax=Allokutzneria sp. A3M-2-11 16 TaxID=2962043 RepID=UPI0020B77FE4|nr:Rv2175c family DNA-binding protein [Allokutzneria sp. A3M-2-11 16]MCP3801751.1 Rv2175c family DNA-binding protein [Allokutzneria sp. A3M-2-11 16]
MSQIPTSPDVLDAEVEVLPLPDVAERLGQPVTRVHQMLRDGQLLAVRRNGIRAVPAAFLTETGVVKHLGGTVTVLRDAGYDIEEILRWLFTSDDSLPGTPIDALRGDRGREVKRRAQALAF